MYKFRACCIAAFALSLVFVLAGPVSAKDTLVLNTWTVPLSNSEGAGATDLQLQEVFKRAQIGLVIEHLPAERALINANSGVDDGTFLRVAGLDKTYSNLIMVPESFMDLEFIVISKDKDVVPNGWGGLDQYHIGIITGWKIVEDNTVNAKSVIRVDTVDQLFQLLSLNRVDLVIYERLRTRVALREKPVEGAVVLEPALVRKPMYLYLHVKNSNLVPKIVEALRASKADGTHERLRAQAVRPY
ncbi:substrate-binding periplasmic protein [Parasedimentitalea maritima]|uniref:Transporter substrate-binding domain-containing protein n=1 Tax=Parasedimentitalea maritima TaxID=2578117 RepID=A0A6A4RI26_9RHOB|nr:transporter substrate-binding domain-containing protein [Zongyanglinia marina]KAE9628646.1 transporter substrate-binding domain-containing protein [Zongyanglinia marina]